MTNIKGFYDAISALPGYSAAVDNSQNTSHLCGVLIPVLTYESSLKILFTQRSANLPTHAGQICFPGGRYDKTDNDLIVTALRETEEEIGISSSAITIINTLPPMTTITGFSVLPVIGFIDEPVSLTINKQEVQKVFYYDLDLILDKNNYKEIQLQRGNKTFTVVNFTASDPMIWGATAKILLDMLNQL